MKAVLSAVTAIKDEDIQSFAIQALCETIFIGYHHLDDYLVEIGKFTHEFVQSGEIQLTHEAFKFWQDLSKKEIARL